MRISPEVEIALTLAATEGDGLGEGLGEDCMTLADVAGGPLASFLPCITPNASAPVPTITTDTATAINP